MVEWFVDSYNNTRWFKLLVGVALCLSGGLLFWAAGGFPPWAWRFLMQVLAQLPALWGAHGAVILLPLVGLGLLSLALFLLWAALLFSVLAIARHWWHDYHARLHFSEDLHDAEQMSEQMLWQEVARQNQPPEQVAFQAEWQPQIASFGAQHAQSEQIQQQPYAVARASRPVRAAVGGSPVSTYTQNRPSIPTRPRPVTTTENLAPRREPLRLVPREPEPEPEDNQDFETLFEIEHPLIETSQPRLLRSSPLADVDVHTDSLQDPRYTEELETALRLVVGIGLDPGIARKHAPNEDNLFAIQAMRAGKKGPHPVGLFVVADGMGGHADGQEASRLAIQVISDAIVPALLQVDADEDSFANLLKEAVHRANLALYRRNREQPEMMGTTLTATLVVDNQAYVANVGDSRTYLYRPLDGLKQVTRDHSLVARMVEDGIITRDDIYTHPRRNQIYRCLGERSTVEVDTFVLDLCPEDVLLLCSDGLWEMVRDTAIQDIIAASATHPAQISTMLVQSALGRGGVDNISVVVVGVVRPEEQS